MPTPRRSNGRERTIAGSSSIACNSWRRPRACPWAIDGAPVRTVLSLLIVAALVAAPTRAALARDAKKWGIGATAYGYSVPDQPDFIMVVAPVDIRWFHIEGRYDYESLHTGSIFLGVNAGTGDKLRLDVTGMVGGVFGDVDGVAPAFRLTLSWWKLDFVQRE